MHSVFTGCRFIDAPIKHWNLIFMNSFSTILGITDVKKVAQLALQ